MNELMIAVNQTPGTITFENYEEVKARLQSYTRTFETVDYSVDGIEAATADYNELKKYRDAVAKKKKELEKGYAAPYITVNKMLDELRSIIDVPYKKAKKFVDDEEDAQKRRQVMEYAAQQAASMGEIGAKIAQSPAFFKKGWLNKTCSVKKYQDEVKAIFRQAAADINSIQLSGGENTSVLMARYYETLSMDGVKSFLESLKEERETVDPGSVPSENNVVGYKILKITATEDQMAGILDQLELMGVEVEEIEDGMPKAMPELTTPSFDSFVAFDIETTGSNGAANGDSEAQITEIGAVRVVGGVITETFDELANPGRDIVPRIARLTHITNEMVADKPPVEEVIRRFYEFVGDSTLVGHNIKSSDLRYIGKAADKAGVHLEVPFLDTYVLARKYKEKMHWEKVSLGYLADYYGLENKESHRAFNDAEVNARIYFELQKLSKES
jgi:DNA polymerase III epsilon subunit family exonuclease